MGRINFGPYLLKNKKGITKNVTLNQQEINGWEMYQFPFDNIKKLQLRKPTIEKNNPVIRKGVFNLQKTGDTYLDMRQWGKGCVWINGHNLGKYWKIGPQQTIFVPAEWLKKGQNEIIIFELLKSEQSTLQGLEGPILDLVK